ncbi:hypothetical protein Tco_0477501 [Tanacetum coccineum]
MKHTKRTLVGILSRTERTLSGGLLNHRNEHPPFRLSRGGYAAATVGAWPEADRKMRRERGGEGDGMMIVGAWMVMLKGDGLAMWSGQGRNLARLRQGAPEIGEEKGGG